MPTDDEKKAPETPKSEPKGDSKPETDAGEKKPAENSECFTKFVKHVG